MNLTPAEQLTPKTSGNVNIQKCFGTASLKLKEVLKKLDRIINVTETEFSELGGKLQEYSVGTKDISELSIIVANKMSGDDIKNSIEKLENLLLEMQKYLQKIDKENERGIGSLNNTLKTIDTVYEAFDGFNKIVKTLSVLGISTKIESARLGSEAGATGFINLAQDVEKLAILINNKSKDIIAKIRVLATNANDTYKKILELDNKHKSSSNDFLSNTTKNLTTLLDVHEMSHGIAKDISTDFEGIHSKVGEFIISMQFQDITKQQIEHVEKALGSILDKIDTITYANQKKEDNEKYETLITIEDVCKLQHSQLKHTRDNYVNAVKNILNSLRGISQNLSGMSKNINILIGSTSRSNATFIDNIKQGSANIIISLPESVKTGKELSGALLSVANTVREMADFIEDIEDIGLEIELIALNARVKAAHIGEKGAALGVLAEAIQKLSSETRVRTSTVSDALKGITAIAEELFNDVDIDDKEKEKEVEQMVGELVQITDNLSNVDNETMGILNQIGNLHEELLCALNETISQNKLQEHCDRDMRSILDTMEEVIKDAASLIPTTQKLKYSRNQNSEVNTLRKNYTMQSERTIHDRTLQLNQKPVNKAVNDAHELGDNVSLF